MSLALRQVMGIAERLRETPDLLCAQEEGRYLVLRPDESGEHRRVEWTTVSPYHEDKEALPLDELRLARIKAASHRTDGSWEVDFFFAPFVVAEGERPFFPYVALCTDHTRGLVIHFSMAAFSESDREFQSAFLQLFEKTKAFPKTILVKKDAVMDFLKPIANSLGFTLKRVKNLKSVEKVKRSLIRHLNP